MTLADRDPQYVQIVNELRVRRLALHLSQEELGKMLGVGSSSVGHWESGRRMPRTEVLFTWCRVLEVSMRALPLYRPPSRDLYTGSLSSRKFVDTGASR